MVKGIFHVNVNVTDFERSLEFYKRLGFKVVRDLGEGGNKYLEQGLGFQRPVGRAALLMIGDDKHATRLDLIEWKSPPTDGKPYPHLYHTGINRIALWTDDLQEIYGKLKATDVKFISEPQLIKNSNGTTSSFVCFYDPDGTVIELIQFK